MARRRRSPGPRSGPYAEGDDAPGVGHGPSMKRQGSAMLATTAFSTPVADHHAIEHQGAQRLTGVTARLHPCLAEEVSTAHVMVRALAVRQEPGGSARGRSAFREGRRFEP